MMRINYCVMPHTIGSCATVACYIMSVDHFLENVMSKQYDSVGYPFNYSRYLYVICFSINTILLANSYLLSPSLFLCPSDSILPFFSRNPNFLFHFLINLQWHPRILVTTPLLILTQLVFDPFLERWPRPR